MQKASRGAVMWLSVVMACRMVGLFMILPVFAFATTLFPGSTVQQVGLAMGIYGLTQACLQIAFGRWSDRIGRKPVVLVGLTIFSLGSVVAACADSMTGVIIGRALQGCGAIGSSCLAWVADLTRDEQRSKAMAMIGMTIGLSFALAIVCGPLLFHHGGLSGIFWFTAIMAWVSMGVVAWVIPAPTRIAASSVVSSGKAYRQVLKHTGLLCMNLSIFTQHAVLMLLFSALPLLLHHTLALSAVGQTQLYLSVFVGAFIAMVPFIIGAEKRGRMKVTLLAAIGVMLATQVALVVLPLQLSVVVLLLWLFFTAFTLLESILPSLVSKIAPLRLKGTALGVYSTCQFAGIFFGGKMGGVILAQFGMNGIFIFGALLCTLWAMCIVNMAKPPMVSTWYFSCAVEAAGCDALMARLQAYPGVMDCVISVPEQLVYVKADKQVIAENELRNVLEHANLSA